MQEMRKLCCAQVSKYFIQKADSTEIPTYFYLKMNVCVGKIFKARLIIVRDATERVGCIVGRGRKHLECPTFRSGRFFE